MQVSARRHGLGAALIEQWRSVSRGPHPVKPGEPGVRLPVESEPLLIAIHTGFGSRRPSGSSSFVTQVPLPSQDGDGPQPVMHDPAQQAVLPLEDLFDLGLGRQRLIGRPPEQLGVYAVEGTGHDLEQGHRVGPDRQGLQLQEQVVQGGRRFQDRLGMGRVSDTGVAAADQKLLADGEEMGRQMDELIVASRPGLPGSPSDQIDRRAQEVRHRSLVDTSGTRSGRIPKAWHTSGMACNGQAAHFRYRLNHSTIR